MEEAHSFFGCELSEMNFLLSTVFNPLKSGAELFKKKQMRVTVEVP